MKVYIVVEDNGACCDPGVHVHGVYKTQKQADEYIESIKHNRYYYVEERDLV